MDAKTKTIILKQCVREILLLLLVMTVGLFGAYRVYAQTSITLKPGQTYDVGKAGRNTSVYINKPGTYTLKGKSNYVRVVICCGDVKCYLDDVSMHASASTNTGRRASPLNIVNDGGTVKLISTSDSYNQLVGYLNPAICKNGTKTKLVFETEDPYTPGVIQAEGGLDGAGIGCVAYASASPWYTDPTGNYVINSGTIRAKGGRRSAGIGGSLDGSLNGLTINGGNVVAVGGEDGAGIGGGYQGTAENITITGGTVRAENNNASGAAAIGGGGGYDGAGALAYGKNITISGGDVTAISSGLGAAIGGGINADGKNIRITGGNVNATTDGYYTNQTPAIGGGGGRYPGSTDVTITGGYIKANGGAEAVAIGTGGGQPGAGMTEYTPSAKVNISGGIVIAKKGKKKESFLRHNDMDIGSSSEHKDDVSVCITGGSVYANKIQNAKNDDGDKLHRVDVTCKEIYTDGDPVHFLADPAFTKDYSYGLNDVFLININKNKSTGMFYPWLPDTSGRIKLITVREHRSGKDDVEYCRYGDFKFSASSGNLLPPTDIVLNVTDPRERSGHAIGVPGEKKLYIDKMPVVASTEVITGYAWGIDEVVADPDGTLKPNTTFTNSDGEWICTDDQKGLNVITGPISYTVHYDPNVPRNASTKNQLSGSVDDETFTYGEGRPLHSFSDAFKLPGYELAAWVDKDGNYMEDEHENPIQPDYLVDKDGAVVTAYAYWVPKGYSIKFTSGINGLEDRYQEARFDQTGTFKPVSEMGWDYPNHTLHGWTINDGSTGSFFEDGASFCNLCNLDADGKPQDAILVASWIGSGNIHVTTTVDGVPVSVTPEGTEMKISRMGDASSSGIELTEDPTNPGHYTKELAGIQTDEYQLSIDGDTQYQIPISKQDLGTLNETSAKSVVINYNTITIGGDEHISSASVRQTGTAPPETSMVVPGGEELLVSAFADEGYHFDGYSWLGVKPVFESDEPNIANQAMLVMGTVELTAHSEANVYTVHFEANAGNGLSGEMEDQDMVYDQEQNLFVNKYKRIGGVFTGWNTEKDGTGANYADKESVKNLITENGGKITLYAQWEMAQYDITYDLDGGELPGDAFNPSKYTAEDSFTLINPAKTDHVFAGWIGTDCDEPTEEVTIPEGSTGDREYIACWKNISFNVTFETNGGSEIDQQSVVIHQKVQKPEDPVREHCTFVGWYADEALSQPYDFSREVTEDITLYAKWDHIMHNITYDLNGGTLDGKTGKIVVEANEGDMITVMKAPTRKGYTFKYWKGSKYNPGDNFLVEKDHTLTAEWKKNKTSDPDDPDDPNNLNNNGGTSTGDDSKILIWTMLMTLSLIGLTVTALARRKHNR